MQLAMGGDQVCYSCGLFENTVHTALLNLLCCESILQFHRLLNSFELKMIDSLELPLMYACYVVQFSFYSLTFSSLTPVTYYPRSQLVKGHRSENFTCSGSILHSAWYAKEGIVTQLYHQVDSKLTQVKAEDSQRWRQIQNPMASPRQLMPVISMPSGTWHVVCEGVNFEVSFNHFQWEHKIPSCQVH